MEQEQQHFSDLATGERAVEAGERAIAWTMEVRMIATAKQHEVAKKQSDEANKIYLATIKEFNAATKQLEVAKKNRESARQQWRDAAEKTDDVNDQRLADQAMMITAVKRAHAAQLRAKAAEEQAKIAGEQVKLAENRGVTPNNQSVESEKQVVTGHDRAEEKGSKNAEKRVFGRLEPDESSDSISYQKRQCVSGLPQNNKKGPELSRFSVWDSLLPG